MVCHCREKLDTEEGPTREEIDFVDIAFPCRARGHIQRGNPFIGIDNRPRPRSSHCNYASNTVHASLVFSSPPDARTGYSLSRYCLVFRLVRYKRKLFFFWLLGIIGSS